jgi:hypothetical protein
MKYLLLFWIFVFAIKCSSSDESGSEKSDTLSSDDENTVNGGNNSDTELTEAINGLNVDEKATFFQRQSHLTQQRTSANGSRPLSCIDGSGREVDWWFLYKHQGSTQYIYYSSFDVQNDRNGFHPLNSKFVINDINTSPVLQTIYHPGNSAESSEVWLGWNDQPENDDSETKDQRDGYGGNVSGVKHAHSKGFYAQNAVFDNNNPNTVTIGSYIMMTSLPRFPRVFSSSNKLYGDAIRNVLPRNPAEIFDSNLNSKAQHFFCMSLPRETVNLQNNLNIYEVPVNFSSAHVKFLHKYLKTIHPAVMGTNYSDHKPSHWIWRRYFSLFQYPAQKAFSLLSSSKFNEQIMAYSKESLPSYQNSKVSEYFQNVFPLTWSNFYVSPQGLIMINPRSGYYRWDAQFSNQNGCRTGDEEECLGSFETYTTSLQSQIPLSFFAKHGLLHMDLYDDWAALHVSESQKNLEKHYTGTVVDRYGLLVQSWIDSRTELPRKPDKKIFDSDGKLMATVHIDNVSYSDLPVHRRDSIRAHSNHRDHSKWAIAFAMETLNTNDDENLNDSENAFVPLVFVADLNRTFTQAKLKNSKQGRGGGAVSTVSINLWRALIKLNPRAGKQDRFANLSKSKASALQNRLRGHIRSYRGLASLPLDPLRPAIFKSLRLSKKESKKPGLKSLDFVPFLNELFEFAKKSENRPEHVSFLAFRKMFKAFANGEVKGQAEESWERALKQNESEEDAEYSCLLEWSEIISLPSLHLHRQIPRDYEYDDEYLKRIELENQAPYLIKDPKGNLVRGDSIDSLMAKLDKIPRHKEIQTETVKTVNIGTSTVSTTESIKSDVSTSTEDFKTIDDEKLFELIESFERSKLASSPLQKSNLNFDADDEISGHVLYRPQFIDEYEHNDNGGGSDSDYSNREIDYEDDEDDDFNEETYDSYEHLYNNNNDSEVDDQSEDNSERDNDEDLDNEYYDHYRRMYRQNNGDDDTEHESD